MNTKTIHGKILFAGLLVWASAMTVTNPVYSQESSNDIAYNTKSFVLPSADFETATINSKAVRDLRKSFATTEELKWYKRQNGYMAVFMMDGVKCRVDYDSKGNWNGTLRNYAEDKLSRDIRTIVKSVYFDYDIKWIWEITVPGITTGPVYIVHIEDAKSFKNVQVSDGEMKVLEHFEKMKSNN